MLSSPETKVDERRIQRVSLTLPVRVESKVNRSYTWDEVTRLNDVSAFGAGFNLRRPLKRGRLVQMTIPLPRQLRCYDYMEPQYKIWALVRSCVPIESRNQEPENYAIGVAFIGKNPPSSYISEPAKLYDLTHLAEKSFWQIVEAEEQPDESDLPKDNRRHTRFQIPVGIVLETMNEEGDVTGSEMTVTENVSLGGAAVFTSLKTEVGSFVRVKSEQYNVSIISVVRGKRDGTDGITRLHVEFIDRFFPLDGID